MKQLAYSTRIDDLLRGRQPGFEAHHDSQAQGITELVTQIWDRHYAQIRKELMRRYPRHSWPEDPRTAEPIVRKPRPPRKE